MAEFLVLFAHMVLVYMVLHTVAKGEGNTEKEELDMFEINDAPAKAKPPAGRAQRRP